MTRCDLFRTIPLLLLFWVDDIERFAQQLRSADAAQRELALHQLAALSTPAITPLVLRALADRNARVTFAAARLAAERRIVAARPLLEDWLVGAPPAARSTAAQTLAELGDPRSIRPLARALTDPEARVRVAVVRALGDLAASQVLPAILAHSDDANSEVRVAVLDASARLGDSRALPFALARAVDPVHNVRAAAARALGQLADARAAPALIPLLEDPHTQVVAAAVSALGRLRVPYAAQALIPLLHHSAATVRRRAARALAATGTVRAVRTLADQLGRPDLHDAVAQALAAAPRPLVAQQLARLIEDPVGHRKAALSALDLAGTLRCRQLYPLLLDQIEIGRLPLLALIHALGQLSDKRAQRTLLVLSSHHSPEVREAALRALRPIADARATAPLLELLSDVYQPVRLQAIELLGLLRNSEARPALQRIALTGSGRDAAAATLALAQLGDDEAVPTLLRLLEHRSAEVRRYASESFARLAGSENANLLLHRCLASTRGARATCIQALGHALRGRRHDEARHFLFAELRGGSPSSRLAALDAIAALADDQAAALLRQTIPRLTTQLQARAVEVLGNFKATADASRDWLAQTLTAGPPRLRAAAAWTAGKLRIAALAPQLLDQVNAPDWATRINALGALARLAHTLSCTTFTQALTHRDPHMRANAALGLAHCQGPLSARRLVERLYDEPSPWVRLNLLRALAFRQLSHTATVEGKRRALRGRQLALTLARADPDERVRKLLSPPHDARSTTAAPSWLGLYIEDSDHQPLRNGRIALITPTGLVKATRTDARAQHWEEHLPAGVCFVERPAPTDD